MVRDGIFYFLGLGIAGAVVGGICGWGWATPLFLLAAFALYFFRNPARPTPVGANVVVSPADGRITCVEELPPGGSFSARISIFLSIFDVHVNRAPIAGRVAERHYRPGRFRSALNPRSADENERNWVRLEGPQGTVAFAQIAGMLARRIVFWPRMGEEVQRGQIVGLIKFGSRVDLFLPAEAELAVAEGQRVKGGLSTLARWPRPLKRRRRRSRRAAAADKRSGHPW